MAVPVTVAEVELETVDAADAVIGGAKDSRAPSGAGKSGTGTATFSVAYKEESASAATALAAEKAAAEAFEGSSVAMSTREVTGTSEIEENP